MGQGRFDLQLLSLVESEVQPRIKSRVICKMVNSRGNNTTFQGHDGGNGFNSAGSPKQMPGHGFCGTDINFKSPLRSEEHTSELQSLMRTSYAVFCLKKKNRQKKNKHKQI